MPDNKAQYTAEPLGVTIARDLEVSIAATMGASVNASECCLWTRIEHCAEDINRLAGTIAELEFDGDSVAKDAAVSRLKLLGEQMNALIARL
jgi:hypothetical protein